VEQAADVDIVSQLAPALRSFGSARTDLSPETLDLVRESLNQRRRQMAERLDTATVDISNDKADSIPIRMYRGAPSPAPAVIYCHAGAFVLGNLDTDHRQCVELARRGQCTVVSVDYRLAPEHPYPAALHDAVAVLKWAATNATELGIDPGRFAVAGSSAGAALAACLAQRAADRSVPPIMLQLLHQPALDDRPTPSKTQFLTTPGFDGPATEMMWRHYLQDAPGEDAAVPGRRRELAGLAPAFISCSQLDPLRDEGLDYATRLRRAGVATELHVFAGTCHGFDSLLPDWQTSQQLFELQGAALRRAMRGT
jgi:acetyl esterase